MAQWDDRDPRWLVEEMGTEGSNVNGWHWEEKNKLQWAKERLGELLGSCQAKFESHEGHAEVTGLKDVTGEVKSEHPDFSTYISICVSCLCHNFPPAAIVLACQIFLHEFPSQSLLRTFLLQYCYS